MLKRPEEYQHIYVACGYTDMRKGIDGLSWIVKKKLGQDPFSGSLFLFCGRARKYFKALSGTGNGFEMYYRRYDGPGATLKWPMSKEDEIAITAEDLYSLMNGFSICPAKGFENYTPKDLS